MSIYATIWDLADDDHALDCARMVKVAGYDAVWETDPDKPCTCHAGPITYQGSHILPSDDDVRGGCLELAAIPGFIDAPDRVLCDEQQCPEPATVCCKRRWPWLRVGVHAGDQSATVVLTRGHVADLHRALGEWLRGTATSGRPTLSRREIQVLHAIAAGRTIPQVAADLHLSPNTVKTVVGRLYRKLAVHTRLGAVNAARELGLLDEGSA